MIDGSEVVWTSVLAEDEQDDLWYPEDYEDYDNLPCGCCSCCGCLCDIWEGSDDE